LNAGKNPLSFGADSCRTLATFIQIDREAMNRTALFIPLAGLLLLATTRDAAAYIDPGSSSYLFQLLIGGLAALLFFFSTLKRKTGQLFRAICGRKDKDAAVPANDPASTPKS
jgi:hypothetical protein